MFKNIYTIINIKDENVEEVIAINYYKWCANMSSIR